MAVKKRSTTAHAKRKRGEAGDGNTTTNKNDLSSQKSAAASWLSLPPLVINSVGVLIVGMVFSLLWNFAHPVDPAVKQFLSKICGEASCSSFVVPARRTLQAIKPILKGTKIATIPRSLQIWDMDALRDPIIRPLILSARHGRTGNLLPSAAFLALYVGMQLQQLTLDGPTSLSNDPMRRSYLEAFPTDLLYHPLLWNLTFLKEELRPHSAAFHIVRSHQDMVESEYLALQKAWIDLYPDEGMINIDRYKEARIHVLSRSFSPGPAVDYMLEEERERWSANIATDFSKGCHAMVPILDLLNHHPQPSVEYHYDKGQQAFVIQTISNVPLGYELYDSYGRFTDAHLFAKFGFVNGDGSGFTQSSISIFHRLMDWDLSEFSFLPFDGNPQYIEAIVKQQRNNLLRYLSYDDGYENCIEGPDVHPKEFELKQLKLKLLVTIANQPKRWITILQPRSPKSTPLESTETPISLKAPVVDPQPVQIRIPSSLIGTCRLLSLTVDDYHGNAAQVLRDQLGNSSFVPLPGSEALEYRSMMCLGRLGSTALFQYPRSVNEEVEHVEHLTATEFQSAAWATAHVRLGEMQTLEAISGLAIAHARKFEQDNFHRMENNPAFKLRQQSCPTEYQTILLEDGHE